MASLRTTRDTYGPSTTGGPVTRLTPRRLSAPRERTLTELGLRDTRFDREPSTPAHSSLMWFECARLHCAIHDRPILAFDNDCAE